MRRGKSKFNYHVPDIEAMRQRMKDSGYGKKSFIKPEFDDFRFKEGDNTIRILPQTFNNPTYHFGMDVSVHFQIGASNSNVLCINEMQQQFYCDDEIEGETCPICKEAFEAKETGDFYYAKELYPRRRVLYWVIVRGEEEKGPQLLSVSKQIDNNLIYSCIDNQAGDIIPVADPYEGFDIFVHRTGTGLTTKYQPFVIARKASPISRNDNKLDEWLEFITNNPLPSVLVYHDNEEIKEIFEGKAVTQIKDEDQDDEGDVKENDMNYSWEEVHNMDFDDLDNIADYVDIDPDDYGDEDLDRYRDSIAEGLGLEPPKPKRVQKSVRDRLKGTRKRAKY